MKSRDWSFRGVSDPISFVGNERVTPVTKAWSCLQESNLSGPATLSTAYQAEGIWHVSCSQFVLVHNTWTDPKNEQELVCMVGFEPTTTRFQGEDSGQAELHTDGDAAGNRTLVSGFADRIESQNSASCAVFG